jgi:peptidase S41-like protein
MSEKLYACVLHLLAPHFYRLYGEEAIRLVRDRCRDERTLVSKIALWLDLIVDLVAVAVRDARFTRQVRLSQVAAAHALRPVPAFAVLSSGLPGTTALLLGGALSLGTLATVPALIGHGGGRATALSLFGVPRLAAPIRATSKATRIGAYTRSLRAHWFGTPGLQAGVTGGSLPVGNPAAIDADEKKRLINGAIANLRESYVYPNVAQKMIDAVLTHERNGDYKGEVNGSEFAALLTKHLQDVSHDLHLRVVYSTTEVPPLGPPERDPNFQSRIERDNCAFREVKILPDNIGYLRFDAFLPPSLCGGTATAAMQFLAHVDALIFDLRENHGGDPHMTAFMASYLFDRRTHLNDIYDQRDHSTQEFWTTQDVTGPRFGKTPVYVLTSATTFSGAEEFTYNLKNLKRAVIVGETTGGGAHLVMMHRLDAHFIIGVPFARPINPISKTDWEGTGVAPDVKVKRANALETAERLAKRNLETK